MARINPVHDDGETVVYACDLDTDADIELSSALSCLSPEELERMHRFVFRVDQIRYARSRGFLRHRLGQHLGIPASAVALAVEPNGKPFVPDSDVTFNLSHSQGLAVVAISEAPAIGIDLELSDKRFTQNTDLIELGLNCFVESELDVLASMSQVKRTDTFLKFWTAKEARMKLWGEGMALDPKEIPLCLHNGLPTGFSKDPDIGLHFVQLDDANTNCCFARSSKRDAIGVHDG